ncbi:MAG: hypothetical protein HEQ39_09640 [Rhizobacter sp.]
MLQITRAGSIADVIAQVRGVPARVIPYAASTALTRTAQASQKKIVGLMPSLFDQPTRYTLNSTRIVPSTVQTLSARVAVKDQAGAGNTPENFLLPNVAGGQRKEKRYERAMRYAGVLLAGERTVLSRSAPRDASGNLPRSELSRIMALTGSRSVSKRRSKASVAGDKAYFVGIVSGQRGVWKRKGRSVEPILIFTRKSPVYRKRFDFEGIARNEANSNFKAEFYRAADALIQRRGG